METRCVRATAASVLHNLTASESGRTWTLRDAGTLIVRGNRCTEKTSVLRAAANEFDERTIRRLRLFLVKPRYTTTYSNHSQGEEGEKAVGNNGESL